MKLIHLNKYHSIFRLKLNLKITKKIKKSNKNDIYINYKIDKNTTIKYRLIKFNNGKYNCYLATSLINRHKYPLSRLIKIYSKRWSVETEFMYAKYYMTMNNIKSKKYNNVKQDIASIQFISIISGYIEYLINKKYKKNKKNNLYIITHNLLYKLFYKKLTKKLIIKINKLFEIIKNVVVAIQFNRHYKRIKKKPSSKWNINSIHYFYTNKFNKNK